MVQVLGFCGLGTFRISQGEHASFAQLSSGRKDVSHGQRLIVISVPKFDLPPRKIFPAGRARRFSVRQTTFDGLLRVGESCVLPAFLKYLKGYWGKRCGNSDGRATENRNLVVNATHQDGERDPSWSVLLRIAGVSVPKIRPAADIPLRNAPSTLDPLAQSPQAAMP